jgi:hypothetical protein
VIAGGQRATWPVAEVRLAIDGRDVTTPCPVAPNGPALLGAVALESLFLAVDPVAKRLVPVEGYALSGASQPASARYTRKVYVLVGSRSMSGGKLARLSA